MSVEMVGPEAPGELELVRELVNSRDIEAGTDRLDSPSGWTGWASEHGLERAIPGAVDLRFIVEVREALRSAMVANRDRMPLPAASAEVLTRAGSWSMVRPEFTGDGVRLDSDETGSRGVIGQVVAAVTSAMAKGSWSRLKACANEDCRWGFYDHSRSRTGAWCSMEVCGNRAKQTRWRSRQPD